MLMGPDWSDVRSDRNGRDAHRQGSLGILRLERAICRRFCPPNGLLRTKESIARSKPPGRREFNDSWQVFSFSVRLMNPALW